MDGEVARGDGGGDGGGGRRGRRGLAGLERDAKRAVPAQALLRQCLKEHGDLWRQSIDALNALVAVQLGLKDVSAARRSLDAHTAALRARFAGTDEEERVERALAKMPSRARLAKAEASRKEGAPPR